MPDDFCRCRCANDLFPLKTFLIFLSTFPLPSSRYRRKAVFHWLYPFRYLMAKKKNIKASTMGMRRDFLAEGCRSLFEIFTTLPQFGVEKKVKEKAVQSLQVWNISAYSGVDFFHKTLLCFGWINSLLARKHTIKPTRQHRILVVHVWTKSIYDFNPHCDVVGNTNQKWIARSLMRVS